LNDGQLATPSFKVRGEAMPKPKLMYIKTLLDDDFPGQDGTSSVEVPFPCPNFTAFIPKGNATHLFNVLHGLPKDQKIPAESASVQTLYRTKKPHIPVKECGVVVTSWV